jgi:hypothetical protein
MDLYLSQRTLKVSSAAKLKMIHPSALPARITIIFVGHGEQRRKTGLRREGKSNAAVPAGSHSPISTRPPLKLLLTMLENVGGVADRKCDQAATGQSGYLLVALITHLPPIMTADPQHSRGTSPAIGEGQGRMSAYVEDPCHFLLERR